MTITAQTPRSGPYDGDGSTNAFAYNFLITDEADLVVSVLAADGTTVSVKTLTTDYTVSGVDNAAGGTVTFVTAPLSGEKVAITREVAITQEVDLQNRGVVSPEVLETALDDLTRIVQDIDERSDRSVKVNVFSTSDIDQLLIDIENLAGIQGDITTVSGINADVTTVAGIDADVTTVAGISANVTTVAGVSTEVAALGPISSDITAVSGISADVTTVAGIAADVTTVAGMAADVTTFADVWQGASASAPAGTFQAGDLYFNTTDDTLKVYDGATWNDAAFDIGTALVDADIGVTVQAYDADLDDWAGKAAPTGAAVGTTDTQTLTNKTLTAPVLQDGLTVDTETANWTGTESLDPANGLVQEITLTGNVTALTDNLADGESLVLHVDDGTAYTITWPTITWVSGDGTAPTLQTTADTIISIWKVGTVLYGFAANGA